MFKREFKIFLLGFFLLPFFNGLILVEDKCVTIKSYYDEPVDVIALMLHTYIDGPDYKDTGYPIMAQGQLNTNEKVMLKCPRVPFFMDSDSFDIIKIVVIFPDGREIITDDHYHYGKADLKFDIEKDGNVSHWIAAFWNMSGKLKNTILKPKNEYVKNEWKPTKD